MVWGFLGAIAGGAIKKSAQRKANQANASEAAKAREFSVQQEESARAYNREQVVDARQYDERQLDDERVYAQSLRDEQRDYSDPAQERARLEAAGFNPLARGDSSNAASIVPSGTPAAVRSGIASAVAASGPFATFSPETGFADAVQGGFQAYQDGIYADREFELRKTQLDMENERLTTLLHNATMRPRIGGIYDRPAQQFGNPDSALGPDGTKVDHPSFFDRLRDGFDLGTHYNDRLTELEPNRNLPATAIMETPWGSEITILNNEVFEEGPMAWGNGMYAGATMLADGFREMGSRAYTSIRKSAPTFDFLIPQRDRTPSTGSSARRMR